ncbi:MAG: multicopper oxidase domain-containing protein [Candidatus Limnocylindrales bacterium]
MTRTTTDEPYAAVGGPPPAALLVSRRTILKQAGLAAGGVGAAAVLAGCASGATAAWTLAPVAASLQATGSPSTLTAAPSSAPSAAATEMAMASDAAASPSAAASSAPIPSGSYTAHDPSPADFAVPAPYRPHLAIPVEFNLTSNDGPSQTILIARSPDKPYASMNFAGQVPAPTLRVTEGDMVRFTLSNLGALNHSIDFHAAQIAWSRVYQEVLPGASFSFDWTARYPGVFMYHCGAGPVLMHIADGMYGMVIVDPKNGRPPAREYVIVQSEFYGSGGQLAKMLNDPPDYVVFNGQANRYKANPLLANTGELVRLYIVNAGPNSSSAFHVIGALFSHYEASGYPGNAQGMHQTIEVPPGDGALVELTFAEPGTYPFVTHKFADASKGATGLFKVS